MCPPNYSPIYLFDSKAAHAINFALDHLEPWEVAEFLGDFRKGDLKSYPDFVDYLARVGIASTP